MKPDVEQQKLITEWVAQGSSLADIQRNLNDTFNQSLTYKEVRFLLDDLDLNIKDTKKKPIPDPQAKKTEETLGKVNVEIDKVVTPGSVMSGQVTFSNGKKSTWTLDALGRVGLNPSTQPPEGDLEEFQKQLSQML